jgi:transcriptional regulator with XRE-family HTH domain
MISCELKNLIAPGDSTKEASGARLKLLRTAMGLTQVAMADIMGTAPNNYQAMEKGLTYPRPTYIQNLYEMKRVDHNFIYAGDAGRLPADVLSQLEAEVKKITTGSGDNSV